MNSYELLEAVRAGRNDLELIEAIANFIYDFDTYGCWDSYGHIEEDGVFEQLKEEAVFLSTEETKTLIEELEFYNNERRAVRS